MNKETTKIFGALIFIVGISLIVFSWTLRVVSPISTEIVPCYDDSHNEILGLRCEEDVNEYADIALWSVIFGVIVMITGEVMYFYGREK